MGKLLLGMLLGALCGAGITAALLLGPFDTTITQPANQSSPATLFDNESLEYLAAGLSSDAPVITGQTDPLKTLEALLSRIKNTQRMSPTGKARLAAVLNTLVATNPIATVEWLTTSTSKHQQTALDQFLRLWVESQGITLLSTLPATWRDAKPEVYRDVFRHLANWQPEATLPHVLALPASSAPNDNLRASLIVNLVYALDAAKMSLIFDAFSKLTASERLKILQWDALELANKAPHQLLAWSRTQAQQQQMLAADAALRAIARTEPKSALVLLDDQPSSIRGSLTDLALRQLASTEPQLAVAEAESRGGYFATVARVWAASDPEAASRWMIEHTPDQRSSSHDPLMGIASSWSSRDLDAALAFADTLPETLRGSWTSAIAAQLEHSDLDKLETLAHAYSHTPYAAEMYTRLAHQRYNKDPEGTLQRVLSLKPSLRDQPLASLIDLAMERAPASAVSLIGNITDQETRMRAIRTVLLRWQDAEDGAMEDWLENQARPDIRDEAYATLARNEPALLTSIQDRKLRVAAYLRNEHHSRSTIGLRRLLEALGLSEAQWDALNAGAIAAAR